MRSSWPATLLLSGLALAHPPSSAYAVHESVQQLPQGWRHVAPASDLNTVRLSVALKQPGLMELKARLELTSNPDHPQYGAHVSRDSLKYFQQPKADSLSEVASWILAHGIHDFVEDGPWVRLNMTVGKANRLLDCKFSKYQHKSEKMVLRAKEYSLPDRLLEHVDFVYPVTQFLGMPQRQELKMRETGKAKRQSIAPQDCSVALVPDCLVRLYNIDYSLPDGQSPTNYGFAGFLDDYPNVPDLQTFLASYSPRRNTTNFSPNYNLTVVSFNGGGTSTTSNGTESQLEMQYGMSFIQPMNVTFFSTGGRGPALNSDGKAKSPKDEDNEPWVEFLEGLLARETIPHVISISYTDTEQSVPLAYARRVCDLFMLVAARGVSVLVASGDGGAANFVDGSCTANDGKNTTKFIPTFPVDCPYVTGVGSTKNYTAASAAPFSGGGFSEYFERPAWQKSAAEAYLAGINGSHSGLYAPNGRGIPDISSIGRLYYMRDSWYMWGTSPSTPVTAAMIALANDKRMRQGKPPLGFLNPLLYSEKVRAALNDITTGTTTGCKLGDRVESGWQAADGWDPATGLGTLDFARFIKALE